MNSQQARQAQQQPSQRLNLAQPKSNVQSQYHTNSQSDQPESIKFESPIILLSTTT